MKQIADLGVSGKRVLLRGDLDVPVQDSGFRIQDSETATRLANLKPSIDYLFNENANVIIIGHIDRPKGPTPTLSTKQLVDPLQKILNRTVVFREDFSNSNGMGSSELESQITLFENLRFWPGEVANDPDFAQKLAHLADFYVNDAFGNCHRAHASMVTLPKLLPSAFGIHLLEEINELSKIVENPQHPLLAIVGGAKIETKLPVIENLSKVADFVLVGGELPIEIGKNKIVLAENVIVATLNKEGKDLCDESIEKFKKVIKGARLIVWNGPQGVYEEGFAHGTLSCARAIIESGAHCVVGGGETTQFLESNRLLSKFSFVSAGGGAMLEFLAGKELPALEALKENEVGS